MKAEDLSKALNSIDEEILEDVIRARESKSEKKKRKASLRPFFSRLLPALGAAALLLLLVFGIRFLPERLGRRQEGPLPDSGDLPLRTLPEITAGGAGFHGYLAEDIAHYDNLNPWSEEAALKTLPVFENTLHYDETGRAENPDLEKMQAVLKEEIRRLGYAEEDFVFSDDTPDEARRKAIKETYAKEGRALPEDIFEARHFYADSKKCSLEVDSELSVRLFYPDGLELPEAKRSLPSAPPESLLESGRYIAAEFPDLLALKTPRLGLRDKEPAVDSRLNTQLFFYEGDGSLEEQILHYNFYPIRVTTNAEGNLRSLCFCRKDLSRKVGDYPLISVEEARRLLESEAYRSTYGGDLPQELKIARAEILYSGRISQKYFLPYYRFLVETELPPDALEAGVSDPTGKNETRKETAEASSGRSGTSASGGQTQASDTGELSLYLVFYVPAVSGDYIENMPQAPAAAK